MNNVWYFIFKQHWFVYRVWHMHAYTEQNVDSIEKLLELLEYSGR